MRNPVPHEISDVAEQLLEDERPNFLPFAALSRPAISPVISSEGRAAEILRRIFDVIVASAALLLTAPLIAIAALLIRCISPGPAFYSQPREGMAGKMFRIWKLRTMHLDAEARLRNLLAVDEPARQHWEQYAKLARDPRVIAVIGQFLRKTSIDELPQFWNVLRGEMSIIGPRPLPEYHLAWLSTEFRGLRQTVKPGITGLWQVLDRSDGNRALQKHDLAYITERSLALDTYILWRTLIVIVKGTGR